MAPRASIATAAGAAEGVYELMRDAIFENDVDRLEELLQQHPQVDIDHHDAGGQTMLHLASFWGRLGIVKVLLAANANMKIKNAAGCTALDLATHWGHSAVAEIIRMRGGPSVWEEKLGRLQIEKEDLQIQYHELQSQLQSKKHQVDALVDEHHQLHVQLQEEKSAHLLSQNQLAQAQRQNQKLQSQLDDMNQSLQQLTAQYHQAMVDKTHAEHVRNEAQTELQAALVHRNEILNEMQTSVKKQEDLTRSWQSAELAANLAESQRNFALAERDRAQKAHVAALAEIVVLEARLSTTENEMMELKTDMAEQIFERRRELLRQRRTERAMEGAFVPPASKHQKDQSDPKDQPDDQWIKPKRKERKDYSLAAREYGDQVRKQERRKLKTRQERQQRVENQYLTQGLQAPIIESEKFQQEFVAKVQEFSIARQEQWQTLQKDRDRQRAFAERQLLRPISTAPMPHRDKTGVGLDGQQPGFGDMRASTCQESVRKKSVVQTSVNYGVYRKYADRPKTEHTTCSSVRSISSPIQDRMQSSFFAHQTLPKQRDLLPPRNSSPQLSKLSEPSEPM